MSQARSKAVDAIIKIRDGTKFGNESVSKFVVFQLNFEAKHYLITQVFVMSRFLQSKRNFIAKKKFEVKR